MLSTCLIGVGNIWIHNYVCAGSLDHGSLFKRPSSLGSRSRVAGCDTTGAAVSRPTRPGRHPRASCCPSPGDVRDPKGHIDTRSYMLVPIPNQSEKNSRNQHF